MTRPWASVISTVCVALIAGLTACAGRAAADILPGCASGAAPGQTVFTVGVSASGTPFVSTYVASAPTASDNVGCTAPSPSAASTFNLNGPGVAAYPFLPPALAVPTAPAAAGIPAAVNMLQIGSYLLMVPATPGLQVYQIAPGYYVVRSLDSTQPVTVVLPLPGVPPAPNTGPIPSVIH